MKPRVFIGSSRESIPVINALVPGLEAEAEVVPWTLESRFPAGDMVLPCLLREASLYDFAIMVFEPDDTVISRGKEIGAPRDNVVFELGLFMGALGRERALLIKPAGANVHILSDLGGLIPVTYTPPVPGSGQTLASALTPAIEQILAAIRKLGPKPNGEVAAYQGARDVLDIGAAMEELLRDAAKRGERAEVLQIGLDMELAWGLIDTRILSAEWVQNLTWRCLVINPDAPTIQAVSSDSVSADIAELQIKRMKRRGSENKESLARRDVIFECRASPIVPVIHGFLVNGTVLLLSLTRTAVDGRLLGGGNAYWRFSKQAGHEATDHFFSAFSDWFSYGWTTGTPV